jgi:hypothetical protein
VRAWEQLIEARIRDWQERRRRGEAPSTDGAGKVDSLETQLFDEVVKLRRLAREQTDPAQQRETLAQAENLRIRLSVLLEKQGLHLLAESLDARIEAEVRAGDAVEE